MIEIIPKKTAKQSKGLRVLFILSIVLLVISLGSYFALIGVGANFEKELTSLKSDIAEFMTAEKTAIETEALSVKDKIDRFSSLLQQHLRPSIVLEFLQDAVHPKVYFTSFSLAPREHVLKLVGTAQNFESLGQQILILQDQDIVSKVELETITTDSRGGIGFNLTVTLKPNIYKISKSVSVSETPPVVEEPVEEEVESSTEPVEVEQNNEQSYGADEEI